MTAGRARRPSRSATTKSEPAHGCWGAVHDKARLLITAWEKSMYKHLSTSMALAMGAALAVSGCSHRTRERSTPTPAASAPAPARSGPAAAASVVMPPYQPTEFTWQLQL
jgi:hypothetical protein